MKDRVVKVINRQKVRPDGELDEAIDKIKIEANNTNTKLRIQFFWPFKGNYWIIDLDKDN